MQDALPQIDLIFRDCSAVSKNKVKGISTGLPIFINLWQGFCSGNSLAVVLCNRE